MERFRSIVVDLDASATVHPALERAARLAQACDASLTIVDVMSPPRVGRYALPDQLEEQLVAQRREQLAHATRGIQGVVTHWKLLFGRPATALVREVLRSGHDLLVRSHI